jgi:ATP-dependent Clp protease ATP-binding subunit ClpA
MDASNLLKPLLSSGDIRCIGSTTFQEFRGIFEKTVRWRDASRKSMCRAVGGRHHRYPARPEGAFRAAHNIEYSDEACAPLPNWHRATSMTGTCRTRPST